MREDDRERNSRTSSFYKNYLYGILILSLFRFQIRVEKFIIDLFETIKEIRGTRKGTSTVVTVDSTQDDLFYHSSFVEMVLSQVSYILQEILYTLLNIRKLFYVLFVKMFTTPFVDFITVLDSCQSMSKVIFSCTKINSNKNIRYI